MGVFKMKIYDRFVHEQKARKVRNIIKKYNLSLVRAICSRMNYVMAVGIDLLDINVIPERMYTEFSKTVNNSDPVTDMIFASSLMSRVRKTLYEDPDCFPVIMNAFRKHSLLNEVVVLMEKEYCKSGCRINGTPNQTCDISWLWWGCSTIIDCGCHWLLDVIIPLRERGCNILWVYTHAIIYSFSIRWSKFFSF